MTNYDQQMTTTSVIALFETNKEERRSFTEDLLQRIESGEVNPLDIHLSVKCMEEIICMLTDSKKYPETSKRYKDVILAEASKYGKKFDYKTAKIEQKEVGTTYDWSKCEDTTLDDLLSMQESLKEKIKARQEFLKTVPEKGLIITDDETGETTTVYRPAKSSSTSIAVSLR
jgi:hypothetical protein